MYLQAVMLFYYVEVMPRLLEIENKYSDVKLKSKMKILTEKHPFCFFKNDGSEPAILNKG